MSNTFITFCKDNAKKVYEREVKNDAKPIIFEKENIMAYHIFVSYDIGVVAEILKTVNKDVSRGCLKQKFGSLSLLV